MIAVFAYDVDPAGRERFEDVYGPDGAWAALFRGADGYLGTELHRSREAPGRYLVLDRWASAEAYERFLERHRESYDRLSAETEALYERETLVGRFDAVPPSAV